jgi:GTP-binding protein HflX
VRSWTHLERQRGGRGFLGGPGERQIESDRRALAEKIDRLKEKLEDVRRTRSLQRSRRQRAPYPVVALVGYTNAGKSTLFNRMTASDVLAKDLLFATLDPTLRAADLASGQRIILSDTVGFISDLPTQLVAAFRATLEEVLEADVIVHVRDIAHPDSEAQRDDVLDVLGSLGIGPEDERPIIEALNKIDLLDHERRSAAQVLARRTQDREVFTLSEPAQVAISAANGEGVAELESLIDRLVTADRRVFSIEVPGGDGRARAFLHEVGDVLSEESDEDRARLLVRLTEKSRGQFAKSFPEAVLTIPAAAAARRSA